MKKTLLSTVITAALLHFAPVSQASADTRQNVSATVVAMCKDKQARIMLLHELTCTKERKIEAVKNLKADRDFRTIYDNYKGYDHNLDRS